MKKMKRREKLGEWIEKYRDAKNLKQDEIAKVIGISTRQWKRYAKGEHISRKRILEISKVLDMPLGRSLLLAGFEPEEPGVDINAYLRRLRDNVFEGQMHEALFNLYDFYYDVNKEEKQQEKQQQPMKALMLANAFTAAAVAIDSMPGWLQREFIVYLLALEKGARKHKFPVSPELQSAARDMIKKTLPIEMLLGGRLPLSAYQKSEGVENSVPYLNPDSSEESTRDQAALPLRFEARLLNPRIDQAAANEAYANIGSRLSDEEQAEIASRAPLMAAIVKAPGRIRAVVADLAAHYREKVEPHGFKALIVAFDRESCVLYKQELDQVMPPEAIDIVMSVWQGDPLEWKQKYRRGKTDVERLLDRYRDPADPLKILIVNSQLLTTFDAPILQAMYLDKPMLEHHLLQAIRRTDRPYPNKTHGLIVDYLGLLDSILRSHDFNYASLRLVFSNLDELKKHSPARYAPVEGERDTFDSLLTDAYVLEEILARTEPEKLREMERVIIARLHLHQHNPVFIAFGQQLEELKERYRQGLMINLEFLKHLLDLARAVVAAEKEVGPGEAQEQVRADLTELFTKVCGNKSPKSVARIVNDMETAVRYNRFPNWQQHPDGKLEVRLTLIKTLQKYKLQRKRKLIDRVYEYMEQYY